jgi:hypothetical protein
MLSSPSRHERDVARHWRRYQMLQFGQLDLGSITVLLCDADGNLLP